MYIQLFVAAWSDLVGFIRNCQFRRVNYRRNENSNFGQLVCLTGRFLEVEETPEMGREW